MKKVSIFAMQYILKGGEVRRFMWTFFCPQLNIYGFMPPCRWLMPRLPLRCIATGQRGTVLYYPPNKLFD